MKDLLGILGRYGPVRRTTADRYRAWCPVCEGRSLLVVVGMFGARPASCVSGCSVGQVVDALKKLDQPPKEL